MGELERMLQPDERRRARERSAMPRRQFVVSRSALRTVLATYVAAAPADLRFVAAQNGKPRIAEAEVEFNLSHSHEIAVIAVARHAVGVDVERVRADVPVGRLANRLFTQAEAAMFMALPERDRREELFRCWTRKEAYAKATGVGRPLGLRSFEVPVASQLPTHHLAGGWFLADLVVAAGYAGAVVVKGGRHRIIPQRLAPA